MIRYKNKILVLALISLVIISSAATITSGGKYKNLQVLPQDITEKNLDSIMNAYTTALRVSCDFCHVAPKTPALSYNPTAPEIDYALDNPMKENARKMIRLQIDINTKYFYFDSLVKPTYLNVVSCNTCHRGKAYPEGD